MSFSFLQTLYQQKNVSIVSISARKSTGLDADVVFDIFRLDDRLCRHEGIDSSENRVHHALH